MFSWYKKNKNTDSQNNYLLFLFKSVFFLHSFNCNLKSLQTYYLTHGDKGNDEILPIIGIFAKNHGK